MPSVDHRLLQEHMDLTQDCCINWKMKVSRNPLPKEDANTYGKRNNRRHQRIMDEWYRVPGYQWLQRRGESWRNCTKLTFFKTIVRTQLTYGSDLQWETFSDHMRWIRPSHTIETYNFSDWETTILYQWSTSEWSQSHWTRQLKLPMFFHFLTRPCFFMITSKDSIEKFHKNPYNPP